MAELRSPRLTSEPVQVVVRRRDQLEKELDSPFRTLAIMSGQQDAPVNVATLKMLTRLVGRGAKLPEPLYGHVAVSLSDGTTCEVAGAGGQPAEPPGRAHHHVP